jgi:hypothetical protein
MSENYLPVVVGAAVVGDHVLRLLFSDGTVGDIVFSAERWTGVLAPLNDSAYFAEVMVDPEAGTLAWPDGIDLAPEPLYEQAKAHPLVAAPEASSSRKILGIFIRPPMYATTGGWPRGDLRTAAGPGSPSCMA